MNSIYILDYFLYVVPENKCSFEIKGDSPLVGKVALQRPCSVLTVST